MISRTSIVLFPLTNKFTSIVFSHWTTTLDLVRRHLQDLGISFARIDGNDKFQQRQKVLDEFRNDAALPVLIMTTGVGAFG